MGRSPCCSKVGLHRGQWTPEEDSLLTNYIEAHGEGKWRSLPNNAGLLRCGKSCRLRWMNYLRPDIKRGDISPDEDDLIVRLHALLGNRWSLIAGRLPGRTDNEIKNYWTTRLSKKLRSEGIDPKTHKKILNPDPPKPKSKPRPKHYKKRAPPKKQIKAVGLVERTKVHLPKSVRPTVLTSLTRDDSSLSTVSPSTSSDQAPYEQIRAWGMEFLIRCEEEHGLMEDPRASDQNMLDKLYEECLQLKKADSEDHGIVLDFDDHDDIDGREARELDSFAESLLI